MKKYTEIIFVLALLFVFACLKYQALRLPLFWDELGVYGKGIFQMIDQGLSLHPRALDPEISRGHPLLYTFTIAGLSKLFGANLFGLRISALIISLGVLSSFYVLLNKIIVNRKRFALIGTCFLAFQALFFAQSALVLPEMLLCLFVLLMLIGYRSNMVILYILAAICGLLTKESSLVFVLCVFAFDFINKLIKGLKTAPSFTYLIPIFAFLLFLIIQKSTYGWYLFPYHSGSLDFSMAPFINKFSGLTKFLFFDQGRWFSSIIITAAILFSRFKKRSKGYFNSDIILLGIFIMAYICFHALCFNMNRYLLPVLPLYCLYFIWSIYYLIPGQRMANLIIILSAVLMMSYWNPKLSVNDFNHADDMSYKNHIEASQKLFAEIRERKLSNKHITLSFPLIYAVEDSRYGYITKGEFKNAQSALDSNTQIYIKQNPPFIDPPNLEDYKLNELYQFKIENVSTYLYEITKE